MFKLRYNPKTKLIYLLVYFKINYDYYKNKTRENLICKYYNIKKIL